MSAPPAAPPRPPLTLGELDVHRGRRPSYTTAMWYWLAEPHPNEQFGGRSTGDVLRSAACLVLLAVAYRLDMQRTAGRLPYRPYTTAADVAVLTGLSASRVRQVLNRFASHPRGVVEREDGGGGRVYYRLRL